MTVRELIAFLFTCDPDKRVSIYEGREVYDVVAEKRENGGVILS